MLHFGEIVFNLTCYATTYYSSGYEYGGRHHEEKPTFENNYVKLEKQTRKIFEYGLNESSSKNTNFLVFHKDNVNNNAYNIVFAPNKKSEKFYVYLVNNKPEVTEFYYNVLRHQEFYRELNVLFGNISVIDNFKPYLEDKQIVINDVRYSLGENMVNFLNMLFLESQNTEQEMGRINASRFNSNIIRDVLNNYSIVNVSRIYLENNRDKFVFYVQFKEGISTCYASELITKEGTVSGKITKISDIKGWFINVLHTKNSRAVAMIVTFFGGAVSVILLIFGGFKLKESNRRFYSEEERIVRERYREEISGRNNTRNSTRNNASEEPIQENNEENRNSV